MANPVSVMTFLRPAPLAGEDVWAAEAGSALHAVLSQAVGDNTNHLVVSEGVGRAPQWSATQSGGVMKISVAYRGSVRRMVRELLTVPPMRLIEPDEAFLYALQVSDYTAAGNFDMYAQVDVDGAVSVWRFEWMSTRGGAFLMSIFRVT